MARFVEFVMRIRVFVNSDYALRDQKVDPFRKRFSCSCDALNTLY